ncbi:hypothetical protein MTP99_005964 [Tenebrio molitor]|nr:hypothetical protein MTP99_005964 [Tenebrio molitor]
MVDSIPLCRPSTTLGLPRTSIPEEGSPSLVFCGCVSFLFSGPRTPNEPPGLDRTPKNRLDSQSRMTTNDTPKSPEILQIPRRPTHFPPFFSLSLIFPNL